MRTWLIWHRIAQLLCVFEVVLANAYEFVKHWRRGLCGGLHCALLA
jgi:hypothetical protein